MNTSHFSLTCPPSRWRCELKSRNDGWVIVEAEEKASFSPVVQEKQPSLPLLKDLHYKAMEEKLQRIIAPLPPKTEGAIVGYGGYIPKKNKIIGVSFARTKELAKLSL